MKVKNKNLQRKTIAMSPEETKKAIIHYLEDKEHSFEEEKDDGTMEFIGIKEGESGRTILVGDNTSVEFNDKGGATVITFYG